MLKNINKYEKLVNSISELITKFNDKEEETDRYITHAITYDSINNSVFVKFSNLEENPVSFTVVSTK
jgi:hypothetical protein